MKLRYFNARGRAEHIRYILVAAGVAFEDERFTREKWPEIQATLPLPICPVFVNDNGEVMQQSLAIGAALAQKYGLLGSNAWEMGKICEIAHNHKDQIQAVGKEGIGQLIHSGADQKEIDAAADRYFNGAFVKFMQYNEKALTDGGGTWFVGGRMSWADLAIGEFLQRIENFRPGCIDAYPKCKALVKRVHEVPNIAKYVAQRPQTIF